MHRFFNYQPFVTSFKLTFSYRFYKFLTMVNKLTNPKIVHTIVLRKKKTFPRAESKEIIEIKGFKSAK